MTENTERPQESRQDRIGSIDFLKVIGLLGIITAHTGPPEWMIMLRCFDVPLMVILSAMLGERSYMRKLSTAGALRTYYASRFKRLVIPTWLFLVLYFTLSWIMNGERNSFRYYLDSFLLTRYGIAYVWVILVYLYSALLIPLFCRWKLSWQGFAAVAAAYALYELMYHLGIGKDCRLVDMTLFYLVPYGLLTWLGCNYRHMPKRLRLGVMAGSLMLFAGLAVYGRVTGGAWVSVQDMKYPPRLYFLAYGAGCSFALLAFCERVPLRLYRHPAIRYISEHSMWIYLWHILMLKIYEKLKLPEIWYLKLAAVVLAAVFTVMCVNCCLDAVEKRKKISCLRWLRG